MKMTTLFSLTKNKGRNRTKSIFHCLKNIHKKTQTRKKNSLWRHENHVSEGVFCVFHPKVIAFTLWKLSLYPLKAMLSWGKSIAFGTKKGAFQPPFLYPYTDYQIVTTIYRFRCTQPAGNNFEISQAWGVKKKHKIGQNRFLRKKRPLENLIRAVLFYYIRNTILSVCRWFCISCRYAVW